MKEHDLLQGTYEGIPADTKLQFYEKHLLLYRYYMYSYFYND